MAGLVIENLLKDDGEDASRDVEKGTNPFSFSNFVGAKRSPLNNENAESASSSVSESSKAFNLSQLISDESETKNPFSIKNFNASNANRKITKKLQIIDDTDTGNSNLVTSDAKETTGNDSDSEWDEISQSPQNDPPVMLTNSEEKVHLVKIDQLCNENASLRGDLSKIKEEFLEYRRTANKRVTSLQKELGKVRKKEAEEAQDLENAVRMVEENLQKTTARATKAESTVAKLKEEVKLLQEENVPKAKYDALVLEHSRLVNTVQEKSRNVSQLMRTAADKTEPHIKQLQSGVSSLRFFAQQFDDICKITEVPGEKNRGDGVT